MPCLRNARLFVLVFFSGFLFSFFYPLRFFIQEVFMVLWDLRWLRHRIPFSFKTLIIPFLECNVVQLGNVRQYIFLQIWRILTSDAKKAYYYHNFNFFKSRLPSVLPYYLSLILKLFHYPSYIRMTSIDVYNLCENFEWRNIRLIVEQE